MHPCPAHVKYLESRRKNNHANIFFSSLLVELEEGLIKKLITMAITRIANNVMKDLSA